MKMPPVQFDSVVCGSGLDQITPTLSLKAGAARQAVNFECGVTGGYSRIEGYERFDGHPSPSGADAASSMVVVAALVNTPTVGQTITASGGASGVLAYITGLQLGMAKVAGTFVVGDVLSVGATTIGTVTDADTGPTTPSMDAAFKNAATDILRADIAAVPGSGPIRGVAMLAGVVYAFRNAADGLSVAIYKSSATGWVNVPLFRTVTFSAGTTAPADGATLTQGGVTAVIKRVVHTAGAWTGSAAGRLVIATPAGGSFAAGAATVGSTTLTLAGADAALAIAPGGKFEFVVANFAGQAATERIYGCDGVNPAFEFDGTILAPILTGANPDTPTHILAHRNYLWLAVKSSVMYSGPGLPYNFSALAGAGEIATGSDITGLVTMTGGSNATMGIFSRTTTDILYGESPSNFNLISYDTGSGANPYTVQSMAQTLVFDDSGVTAIQAALQYGNFSQGTLTAPILPFIADRLTKCTWATLNRDKSQYRVFFSDSYGLYVTIVNGKNMGAMPVLFANDVTCAVEGKLSTGENVSYFGSTNGKVYQLDKGTSFDGEPIEWSLVLNYTSARSPRVKKRYRKAAVELSCPGASYIDMFIGYALGYDSVEYEQFYSDPQSLFLSNSDAYTTYLANSRWDAFVWDDFFWDTRGLSPVEVNLSGTAENIALSFMGYADYVPQFTINSIIIHHTPRRAMR